MFYNSAIKKGSKYENNDQNGCHYHGSCKTRRSIIYTLIYNGKVSFELIEVIYAFFTPAIEAPIVKYVYFIQHIIITSRVKKNRDAEFVRIQLMSINRLILSCGLWLAAEMLDVFATDSICGSTHVEIIIAIIHVPTKNDVVMTNAARSGGRTSSSLIWSSTVAT